MTTRQRTIVGWVAVCLGTALSCFWAFWGIIENFHEGWYHRSVWMNLAMMFVQYLSPTLFFLVAGLAGSLRPRAGGVLYAAIAVFAAWFFRGASFMVLGVTIVLPLGLLALLFWFGRPRPRWLAATVVAAATALTLVASGAYPAWRVATRVDDGNRGARRVSAGGVELVWAPAGPGWPDNGVSYEEAVRRCRFLNADGTALAAELQDLWRLPTIEEAVAASSLHGRTCGGTWDPDAARASFPGCAPDKEPPLWDPYTKIIYWWTATEAPGGKRYRMAYNGHVTALPPKTHWGYLGFRAVKAAPSAIR